MEWSICALKDLPIDGRRNFKIAHSDSRTRQKSLPAHLLTWNCLVFGMKHSFHNDQKWKNSGIVGTLWGHSQMTSASKLKTEGGGGQKSSKCADICIVK